MRRSLALLCEPVQPPQGELEHIHYFCGNTEIPTDLEEREPQRAASTKRQHRLSAPTATSPTSWTPPDTVVRTSRASKDSLSITSLSRDHSQGQWRKLGPQSL